MAMAYSSGFNLQSLKQSLYRKQTMVDLGVKAAVEQGAELILEQAKKNVPVDTYNLEDAIHIGNRRTRTGNHAVDIEVSGEGRDGRDVEAYALEIHENYQTYNPGERTLAKRASNPETFVGEKYMERAIDEKRKEAVDLVRQAVRKAVN